MIRHRQAHRSRRRGFTLVEAVGTIVILGAVGTVATNLLLTAADGYGQATTRAQLHSELSMAMDRIVREFRAIDLDNGASGIAPDIDNSDAEAITWHTDSTLELSGTTLELTLDGGTTATLLTDVTAMDLVTYDEDNVELRDAMSGAQCDDIRRIRLTLTVTRFGVSETLRSRVFIRSCMVRGGTDP